MKLLVLVFFFFYGISFSQTASYDSDSSVSSISSTSSQNSEEQIAVDFGVKLCTNPDDFTLIYNSFNQYDQIVANDRNATFVVDIQMIRKNRPIVKRIRESNGEQKLILMKYFDFNLMTRRMSMDDLVEVALNVASEFKEKTHMDLQYIMLPIYTPSIVHCAFGNIGVKTIYANKSITGLEGHEEPLSGIILIETGSRQFQYNDYITFAQSSSIPLEICMKEFEDDQCNNDENIPVQLELEPIPVLVPVPQNNHNSFLPQNFLKLGLKTVILMVVMYRFIYYFVSSMMHQ